VLALQAGLTDRVYFLMVEEKLNLIIFWCAFILYFYNVGWLVGMIKSNAVISRPLCLGY
jgi:hypothetical protein